MRRATHWPGPRPAPRRAPPCPRCALRHALEKCKQKGLPGQHKLFALFYGA